MSNYSSLIPEVYTCSTATASSAVGAAFSFTKIALLVPLYTFIIYLGVQKWKQQRSFATTSHSDIFTYHLAALTVFEQLASLLYLSNAGGSQTMPRWLTFLFDITWYGESYVQVLTCVEQYLAVVHPIVYMRLKNSLGVRIRNISIGCVWLLTLMSSALVSVYVDPRVPYLFFIPFVVCLVVVSFCCLSVLCVLIRPGPGEGTRVDQSKRRAFNTILAIFVVLVLWFGGISVSYAFYSILPVSYEVRCVIVFLSYWFNLPSGLVLPLLYLHRAGKLSFCCHSNAPK